MTILSAQFGNAANSVVRAQTDEAGEVVIDLADEHDISGGWRDIYNDWATTNTTAAYVAPTFPTP